MAYFGVLYEDGDELTATVIEAEEEKKLRELFPRMRITKPHETKGQAISESLALLLMAQIGLEDLPRRELNGEDNLQVRNAGVRLLCQYTAERRFS